jgi:hypothetical protein
VHSAKNISGPWVQQSRDVNCQAEAPMCGAPGFPKEDRPLSITIHAQGLGLSKIGDEFIWQVCAETHSLTVNLLTHHRKNRNYQDRLGTNVWMYPHLQALVSAPQGERWLSAPGNNESCGSLCEACGPTAGALNYGENYTKGYDFSYWIPLKFGADGVIQQFDSFVDSWALQLPPPPAGATHTDAAVSTTSR